MTKILQVENLAKHYPLRGGLLNRVKGRIKAVDNVSFEVEEGTTFGIAGESGSGKSTLCMTIAKLLDPTSGRIVMDGRDYARSRGRELLEFRAKLQIVFQNPLSSLDPQMTVGTIVLEPLRALGRLHSMDKERTITDLLEKVGLAGSLAKRYPHELSGGQAQRVSIARALSVSPRLLLLDEPTSALDASVQAQILNLFNELQRELGITYVLVSHDLSVIGHMCDQVAIMYSGKFVETGSFRQVFYEAHHPYTAALLGSAHLVGPPENEERFILKGEMPSPRNPPSGCTLHPRCPFVTQVCKEKYPDALDVGGGHLAACHNQQPVVSALKGTVAPTVT
jgi:peptide/nickel transport system ATP-binding protein/oligopeptide transport system ATP-binding protein